MLRFFCTSVSCDMSARYSKLEKKQLSDGAVPSNFSAEFWPLIGILGGFAVMFGNVGGEAVCVGVMVLSSVSEDSGVELSGDGKPGSVFDSLSKKSDVTVGSGVVWVWKEGERMVNSILDQSDDVREQTTVFGGVGFTQSEKYAGVNLFFCFFLFHHFITRPYRIHVSRTYGRANK
jgi:hypothetical protein